MTGLRVGPGFLVPLFKFGLNAAFVVPFLPAHNLPHHGRLAGLVQQLRVGTGLLAGAAAWRLFSLTHNQILL